MNQATLFLAFLLVVFPLHSFGECADTGEPAGQRQDCAEENERDRPSSMQLPEDAMARVNELDVKLRFFKSIGFHSQSDDQLEQIVTIYEEHGVPLPDEYQK